MRPLSSSLFFLRFPFFVLVLRYRSIFFAFFGRRWIARQLPIRIIWQEIPRAPVTVRHLCPRRPRRHSASHFCYPSSLRPGVSTAAIAIRSLTNLFDKSPRLIGLTTWPRLFFPSAKFTVVTRPLVAPPTSLKPLPFTFQISPSPLSTIFPFYLRLFLLRISQTVSVIRGKVCELVGKRCSSLISWIKVLWTNAIGWKDAPFPFCRMNYESLIKNWRNLFDEKLFKIVCAKVFEKF